ncbi:MAG TPA: hypothetical protein VK211_08655 [Kamptonema sp.]|nr:hypothetical protein [Kamptonema sp.]
MPTIIDIPTYEVNGQTRFTKKAARDLLKISNRGQFNQYLETLNIWIIGWHEIKEMLALKLFLAANYGYHSHTMWGNLNQEQRAIALAHFQINLNQEFRRLQDEYRTQSNTRYVEECSTAKARNSAATTISTQIN